MDGIEGKPEPCLIGRCTIHCAPERCSDTAIGIRFPRYRSLSASEKFPMKGSIA